MLIGDIVEVDIGARGKRRLALRVDQEVHPVHVHVGNQVAGVFLCIDVIQNAVVLIVVRPYGHVEMPVELVGQALDACVAVVLTGLAAAAATGKAPQVFLVLAGDIGGDQFARVERFTERAVGLALGNDKPVVADPGDVQWHGVLGQLQDAGDRHLGQLVDDQLVRVAAGIINAYGKVVAIG